MIFFILVRFWLPKDKVHCFYTTYNCLSSREYACVNIKHIALDGLYYSWFPVIV